MPQGHLAAVVTHLEMIRPPIARSTPQMSASLTLRRLGAADLDDYRALFRAVGEEWLWFSRLRMDASTLAAILTDADVEAYAVHDGAEPVGLLELDFRVAHECELAFFGLVASHTGQGVGTRLMHEALTRAWRDDVARVHVHTCTLDHPAAVAFYVRSGFTPYKREVEVAPDPRLTGELPTHIGAHAPVIAP